MLTFCACTAENEAADTSDSVSAPVSKAIHSEEPGEISEDVSSKASEASNAVSNVSETKTLEKITVEHGVYEFYDNGVGEYHTEFDTVKNEENGNLTLNLKDGRSVELVYGEILFDEKEGIYKTEINGFTFWVEDITDGEGRSVQKLECIDRPERSIFVKYYPELDCGDLLICFDYEANGSEYTFKYADGNTSVKTILFDEETNEYYFG